MDQPATTTAQELDLQLPSGRIHVERFGSAAAHLAIGVPGVSANLKGLTFIAERVAGDGLQVVAMDLRGRGLSEVTGPGTYGWENHARDVIALADALGAEKFSVIGQSMGGAVGMEVARLAPGRMERLVLLDIVGLPDATTLAPINMAIERLGAVYPSVEAYTNLARSLGTITPWSDYWQRYFEYELAPAEGGVAARSNREAVIEDARYGENVGFAEQGGTAHIYKLWEHLDMPVLLLRGTREIMPGLGFIAPAAESARFLKAVPGAELVEIDANHYGINTTQESAGAIKRFLRPAAG
ncbi:MAG TPA: alpha/beta hydrolase [Candidatus Dormibacteraeota bacterium]|nr:alpha/beta hydrolase [Candidatus Dormibacteraeota bacterium]